jgi:hypothetical protein
MLALILAWVWLGLLAYPDCTATIDDWMGPELPNRRTHGPSAKDDTQTGVTCHVRFN